MSQQRLRAIILKAQPVADSLHVDALLESGYFGLFKIPGVLKSTRRSSFHYAPGAVYEVIFRPAGDARVIPKTAELIFSPYAENQEYARLAAVAEIIQVADYLKPAPENSEFFTLMLAALMEIPVSMQEADFHIDRYYRNFLQFLGLLAEPEEGATYAAYDLATGYLTARELAERPRGDFVLPQPWGGAAHRALIRKFLRAQT